MHHREAPVCVHVKGINLKGSFYIKMSQKTAHSSPPLDASKRAIKNETKGAPSYEINKPYLHFNERHKNLVEIGAVARGFFFTS